MKALHNNLKYAMRAQSDIFLDVKVSGVRDAGNRSYIDVTDGYMTMPLVIFGDVPKCKSGSRIKVGPVYYSDQYENFVLKRSGKIMIT